MKIPLLLLFLTLAGCCATKAGPATETVRIVDTGCDWTAPIFVSKADVLTEDTARAILAHNRAGAKVCDWKPRGRP